MYTEVNREEVAVSLYIKRLSDEDAGEYLCTALYAGNLKMSASVSVSVFRKLRILHNILKKSINLSGWRNQAGKGNSFEKREDWKLLKIIDFSWNHLGGRSPGTVRQDWLRFQIKMQSSSQPCSQHWLAQRVCDHIERWVHLVIWISSSQNFVRWFPFQFLVAAAVFQHIFSDF